MTREVIAIFENEEIASAAIHFLQQIGSTASIGSSVSKEKQDASVMVIINTEVENEIAIYEIIRSFSGEYDPNTYNVGVMNSMYNIPEESYEDNETEPIENEFEVGTLGYPFDLLNDDAYIDPNIGLGDHDLLIPFMEPQTPEQQ